MFIVPRASSCSQVILQLVVTGQKELTDIHDIKYYLDVEPRMVSPVNGHKRKSRELQCLGSHLQTCSTSSGVAGSFLHRG